MFPIAVVNTVVLSKSFVHASYAVRINTDTEITTLVTNCKQRVRQWIGENVLTPVEEELKTLTVDDDKAENKGPPPPPRVRRIIGFKTKFLYEYGADQGLEKEDMVPEPCIMAFCYGTQCLIYHLVPPDATPNTTTFAGTSIFLSDDVLGMFSNTAENIFVGDGIKKEVKHYLSDAVENCTAVDVRCPANPVFNAPDLLRATLTSLGSKVMKTKIIPNKLDRYGWENPNLSVQQVENLTVETFTSARIGKALLGSLSSIELP